MISKKVASNENTGNAANLAEILAKYYEKEEANLYILKAYTFGVPVRKHGVDL